MDNDTQAPSRRTNILLRRVVVPSWMLVLVLVMWVVVMVELTVAHPLLMLLALVAYGALIFVEARRRRLRPGGGRRRVELAGLPLDLRPLFDTRPGCHPFIRVRGRGGYRTLKLLKHLDDAFLFSLGVSQDLLAS